MQSASFPALARLSAIADDGAHLLAHLRVCGVRFDARRKVEDAEAFSFKAGGSTLAFPTKLHGTAALQENVARAASAPEPVKHRPLDIVVTEDGRIALLDSATETCLGFVQAKHYRWLRPLLDAEVYAVAPVRAYLLAVTGGTADRPTRGVNLYFTGTAAAVRALYGAGGGSAPEVEEDATELEAAFRAAAEEDAYTSGSVAEVEAATDAGASAPARRRDARGRFLPAAEAEDEAYAAMLERDRLEDAANYASGCDNTRQFVPGGLAVL